MYYTMTMMEPHQRSTKWWRLLPMNDTVQGTSSCEGKVSMKCMKLTNSLFQVFCQWHCYCWVWKSRYLQKWNSARYEKIQSYEKTFDKVFQSNIAVRYYLSILLKHLTINGSFQLKKAEWYIFWLLSLPTLTVSKILWASKQQRKGNNTSISSDFRITKYFWVRL